MSAWEEMGWIKIGLERSITYKIIIKNTNLDHFQ